MKKPAHVPAVWWKIHPWECTRNFLPWQFFPTSIPSLRSSHVPDLGSKLYETQSLDVVQAMRHCIQSPVLSFSITGPSKYLSRCVLCDSTLSTWMAQTFRKIKLNIFGWNGSIFFRKTVLWQTIEYVRSIKLILLQMENNYLLNGNGLEELQVNSVKAWPTKG